MARLSDEEIEERLAGLRGWRREAEAIRRVRARRFEGSVDFVNRLTPEAQNMNHHPDHSEGGLTENDFGQARRIERVEGSPGG
jgi:pterin-4a-carbinolamine dehydratase